ncbi:hypothetical protein DMJ13_07155 [halophilic archaeon]|nr:hypothetical protein DMJ13_07155 [halophilic archaeon]
MALVGSLFVGGVAAHDSDYKKDQKKKTGDTIKQQANSQIWQSQSVNQQNFNRQNAAAVNFRSGSGSDRATVTQSNTQTNANAQVANSEAENEVED